MKQRAAQNGNLATNLATIAQASAHVTGTGNAVRLAKEVAFGRPGPAGRPTDPGTDKRAVVRIGFHSLRHSFVSICREANVPLSIVESIVGHSNPSMTRHYTHTGEIAARAAVANLPSLLSDTKPEGPQRSPESILLEIKAIAEKLTSENWKASREAILAALNSQVVDVAGLPV